MPLINLVTDLKSLKYGKDTPGGGWSGQPYIQSKIPDGFSLKSPDFLLRNGFLAPVDALEDIRRLGKMFGDLKSPNGLLFIAKQNILSNSAVRTQAGGVLNGGAYTPLSTLAQAGLVAFGGHLNKQGIDPTGLSPLSLRTYSDVVNPQIGPSIKAVNNNRLVNLASKKIKGNYVGNIGLSLIDNNISLLDNLLTYRGGPGSILGVGFTNIGFADQRTGENNPNYIPYENYIVKSVLNGKQEGGLKIDTGNGTKGWIKGGVYFDGNAKNVYFVDSGDFPIGLPSSNVNTPQSSSLSNIPDGSKTWTPNKYNPDSLKYLKSSNNKGVSGTYIKLTSGSSASVLDSFYNNDGQLGAYYNFSVYEPIIPNNTWPKNSNLINAQYTYTYNQQNIIDTELNDGKLIGSPKLQDFRKILRKKLPLQAGDTGAENAKRTGATPDTPAYDSGKAYENRVNIGSKNSLGPGNSTNKNLVSYTAGSGIGPVDLINALPIYRSTSVAQNSLEYPVNDLIKFRIAAIDNNNPQFKTFMHFRAFLDSFNDSYSATWGDVRYLGRGEKFYNYNGFDRTITLSFTVAAQSKQELIPMYKKLNYLASNLAPDYSPFGYMRGPLVQLTVGGYLYEQVGFITALTYDIPNDSPFEIGINDAGDSDPSVKELPHRINISSFSFTPIHDFVPQKQGLGFNSLGLNDSSDGATGFVTRYGKQRYIALTAGGASNYDDYAGEVFIEREEEPTVSESSLLDDFILREGL